MENLTNERKQKLTRINIVRKQISEALKSGFLTDDDIIALARKDSNYGIRNVTECNNFKVKMLKNIFNCPFLLCDQEYLSDVIKALLPYFLNARYKTEKDTLECYLEQYFIDENEYEKELDDLEFYFYKSSNDGLSIYETGHVVCNTKNILVKK